MVVVKIGLDKSRAGVLLLNLCMKGRCDIIWIGIDNGVELGVDIGY